MSESTTNPDAELLAVFDRICAADADPEALAQLQHLLRSRPEVAAQFLSYMAMHADIYGVVRLSRMRKIVECELGASDASLASRLRAWKVARIVGPLVAIAAMLLLALVFIDRDDNPLAVLRWPNTVASLNRLEEVVWSEASKAYEAGGMVTRGGEIRIDAGLLEVEFRDGAVVVLEGPAHLIATQSNRAELLSGNLAAFAPPWAKGFRVDTPDLDVVDHGTRFAVRVDTVAAKPMVDVMVAEGEVEVFESDTAVKSRRLFAGQGLRTGGREIRQHQDHDEAMQLVAKLPKRLEGHNVVIVGDRWNDWQPGEEGQPNRKGAWRYFTNVGGPFGEPGSYEELLWTPGSMGFYGPSGVTIKRPDNLLGYVKAHRAGGHPGHGKSQSPDGLDHYSITGFIVPEDGVYRIEGGWLERPEPKRWDLDHVLDVAVHVNDGPVTLREFCDRSCYMQFASPLGQLKAGDTIYVGVGPSGVDYNDRFRWGFYIVREVDPTANVKNQAVPRDEPVVNSSQVSDGLHPQSKNAFAS